MADELISRNDAIEFFQRYYGSVQNAVMAVKMLNALDAVDAVKVVRCRECIHSRERNSYEKEYLVEGVVICTNDDVHEDAWGVMYEDDFCSYGEGR